MIVTAPAKINLTLRIRGKRSDGYHAIESILQMLSLADTLEIEDAESLIFTCSEPELATDENLVMRAARILLAYSSSSRGARLHLEKRIPTQAGLGGGSSDAAAALMALNEFWDIRLATDELNHLARQLGSDVPFFLGTPTAIVQGRGECVTPLIHHLEAQVVLAKPAKGLSTARVYGRAGNYQLLNAPLAVRLLPETIAMQHALVNQDLEGVCRSLTNALEGPAMQLMPELFSLREQMLDQGCMAVLLCGSGSTLLGICPDAASAQHAAVSLRNDFHWTWSGPWLPSL